MIEPSQKSAQTQLIEDGFCVVDGRLPEGKIQELSSWADHWLETTDHPSRWKYQGSDIFISGTRHHYKRGKELPKSEHVDFLIEHSQPILESLGLGDFKSGGAYQIISKPPKAPPLYWHQDWARWDDPISMSPWPQQVFLNWYLSSTSTENGCIRAIPGSHRKRLELHNHLVDAHEGGGYNVEVTNEWMFCDHEDAVDIPVQPGQLMIGDARVLHSTHPNNSGIRRTVLLGWFYRKANTVPDYWQYEVPVEIEQRDPELPFQWNRTPGEFLRSES